MSSYEMWLCCRYVDFINLMAYDFHGAWEAQTGHHSPLHRGKAERWYAAQLNVVSLNCHCQAGVIGAVTLIISFPFFLCPAKVRTYVDHFVLIKVLKYFFSKHTFLIPKYIVLRTTWKCKLSHHWSWYIYRLQKIWMI